MNKSELEQLKAKIYKQIDQLNDETALQMLEEAVAVYSSPPNKDILDELTPEKELRLKESIQQTIDGKTINNDEVKQKAKEWLSR